VPPVVVESSAPDPQPVAAESSPAEDGPAPADPAVP